jgi:hypothetical protein
MPWMRADLRTGVRTFSLTGLRDAIAPVGAHPPQRMRAVLLISTGSLSSHRFASSIDGSLAPCFNSKLLGDTMAAALVQNIARWDEFPSSQFGQINSLKRKTIGTSISLFKLPLKFSDRRRKSKRSNSGKNQGEPPSGPTWAGRPTLFRRPVWSGFPCTALFSLSRPMGKSWPSKSSRETPENEKKTIYKNPCLVFRPRPDVRAVLPW